MESPKLKQEEVDLLKAGGCLALFIFSFKSILIAFAVIIFSLMTIFANRGNDIIRPKSIDPYADNFGYNNKLVAITGKLEIEGIIDEDMPDIENIICLRKKVEKYSLRERPKTKATLNLYKSDEIDTSYFHYKAWTTVPQPTRHFNDSKMHSYYYDSNATCNLYSSNIKIGNYYVDFHKLNTSYSPYLFNAQTKILHKGKGTLKQPIIEDIKTTYTFVEKPNEKITIVGKLDERNKILVPYKHNNGKEIYTAADKKTRHKINKFVYKKPKKKNWGSKIFCFLAIWFCLFWIVGPISLFYDAIPILKKRVPIVEDIIETGIITSALILLAMGISKLFPDLGNYIGYILMRTLVEILKSIFG